MVYTDSDEVPMLLDLSGSAAVGQTERRALYGRMRAVEAALSPAEPTRETSGDSRTITLAAILMPISSLTALSLAFIRAAKRGQFDDLSTPAIRMLQDDEEVK